MTKIAQFMWFFFAVACLAQTQAGDAPPAVKQGDSGVVPLVHP